VVALANACFPHDGDRWGSLSVYDAMQDRLAAAVVRQRLMKQTSAHPRTSRAKRKVEAQQFLEDARTLAVSRSKSARGKALELLNLASRMGNAEASYAIGTWHLYGRHVPKNFSAAARFFERAAKQSYAPAAFDLAVMCETGRGVSFACL
jgi:TPR repeat protein